MAYDKLKTESYALLKGINSKASPYINGPQEFLDIQNMDFFQPGSLTKRWGTTLYINATVAGRIASGVEFEKLNGASFMFVNANTNLYYLTSGFNSVATGLLNNGLFDFVPFVDRMFAANGQDFLKIAGQTSALYGVPQPPFPTGISLLYGTTGLPAGQYLFSYAYMDDLAYIGQAATPILAIATTFVVNATILGVTLRAGYGITALVGYRSGDITGGGDDTLLGVSLSYVLGSGATTALIPAAGLVNPSTETANVEPGLTLIPRYLEIYNNQLMKAGFSQALSTVYWSEIGQPEAVLPESFAEVRTNDGDRITGLKSSFQSLFITKERSFHRLSGDDPSNFLLSEISDQYGCISNRAMVTYESFLWFLDTKGIVEFDGSSPRMISNPVEPIFMRMNLSAARENASAIHNKEKNQVEFYIPIDGSTMLNCTVVYDYLAQAWTTYKGLNVSSIWMGMGTLGQRGLLFGGYTGNVFNYDKNLYSDNGSGITCVVKSSFDSKIAQTTEAQFRRLYTNVNNVGSSQFINVNMYANYNATTIIKSASFIQGASFQTRIEFGVPARAMAFEWLHASSSLPFRLDGYGVVYRFQRDI